jgi:hypothetical protein
LSLLACYRTLVVLQVTFFVIEDAMLISIITAAKEPATVQPHVLDLLLACGKVHAFERSSGWVVVGRDPLRASKSTYHGVERRSVAVRLPS